MTTTRTGYKVRFRFGAVVGHGHGHAFASDDEELTQNLRGKPRLREPPTATAETIADAVGGFTRLHIVQ
ncbi:hypothetical protein [Cryobacterium sp. Y82]|uniref:hypothetical protein n=1 Tax=Cryobacterium sp. Y82 TaxID=2045017 RepID=UPI000CE437DB|nr:hypothetical protein [Cryobacterium sp. Y82]